MSELAIGIMSGTSADGIDAAVVGLDRDGRVEGVIVHRHWPFIASLRERILAAAAGSPVRNTAHEVALLHTELGDRYAEAATAMIEAAAARPSVIGLHGQTIAHFPSEKTTFQIGDATRVAVRTGIPVVCDFRSADVALGGQGAPLVPFGDHILFGRGAPRVVVNIGGIANVTLIPDDERDHVAGLDTGPGNIVIDLIARTMGREYDEGGAGARRGRVLESAIQTALAHPYFRRPAPKSTGREDFGTRFAEELLSAVRRGGGSVDDALATATELSARTIADAILRGGTPWKDVLVAGGGASNPALMEALQRRLHPIPLRRTDELGVPAEAREAVAFAILALYRMRGLPNTLPRVTGASRAVSAGAVHQP